jgi:hypothetical protein
MRQRCLVVLVALLLLPALTSADPERPPTLSDLTKAGAGTYQPRQREEPFAGRLLSALKHPGGEFRASGWSTGPDYEQCTGSLVDSTSVSDLLGFYAAQLSEAGWSSTLVHQDGPIAIQAWRFTDSSAAILACSLDH